MAERLDEQALKALLSQEIASAKHYDDEELSDKRARAMEYYRGEMTDTPAAKGRSSVVSRDVADTIGWMLPGIIRVFTSSDRMAEYEPVGPNDEEGAKQATDYVNHIFWKDNPGYRLLWDTTHDSLLQGNGVVKHWWDESEECEYSVHSGLTEEQVALLMEDGGEVVAQREGAPQTVPGPQGPIELQTFDLKLKYVTKTGKARLECIEPENFLLDSDATCIDDARFCAHRDEKTKSELLEMGFDRDMVEALPVYDRVGDSEETIAREGYTALGFTGNEAMQPIELYECYVKADADGDGIAETIRAYYAGKGGAGELLDWEVWDDDVPFSDIPCEPVPHRWDARSVADETMDLQRINTVLTRQMLDNLYWVSNPLMVAQQDTVVNPEMMVAPVFGGTVWLNKKAEVPPTPLPVPFVGDKVLQGLEHFLNVREMRTGVSRGTMALDPETLQNQTATANQNQRDAAYSQIELIARNQAELGWRNVFRKLLRLIVKHQDRPRTIRLRDKWVEMDPRYWNSNMDVTINVGLGTGSRDRDMAMLNNILLTQQGITQGLQAAGFQDKALDMLPKIVKTATKLAESSGIRNPDEYYLTVTEEDVAQLKQRLEQQAAQGDPALQAEMAKAQAQMQLEQVKMQIGVQAEQAKMQAGIEKERAQMEADLVVKDKELQNQLAVEAGKLQLERERMAEESRQKDLDRRLTLQVEMMKIEAQERSAERQAQAARESNQLQREQGERDAAVKVKIAQQEPKPKGTGK